MVRERNEGSPVVSLCPLFCCIFIRKTLNEGWAVWYPSASKKIHARTPAPLLFKAIFVCCKQIPRVSSCGTTCLKPPWSGLTFTLLPHPLYVLFAACRFYHGDYHHPPAHSKCVLLWLSQVSVSAVPGICRRGEALGLPHCCLPLYSSPHTPYQVSPEPPFGYNLSAIVTGAHPHFRAALIYGKGTRFPYSELMMGIYSPNMFLNGLTESPGWAACMVRAPGGGGVGVGGETALCIPAGRVGSSCIMPICFACSPFLILRKENMRQALSSSWKEFHFFFSSYPPSFPLSCLHLDPCTWLKKPLTPVLSMEIVYNRKGKLSVSTRPRCLPQKEIQWRREDYWSVDGVLPLSCLFFFFFFFTVFLGIFMDRRQNRDSESALYLQRWLPGAFVLMGWNVFCPWGIRTDWVLL